MLRSDLYDYSDAYIVVKGTITVEGYDDNKKKDKNLSFKNNALFRSCISKIDDTFIDNAEELDIVMPMYNLLEYSDNHSMTSGSLWNYCRDEIDDDADENNAAINKINNTKTITSKSFEYKTKLIGTISDNKNVLDVEVVVRLNCLSNFRSSLDLPLISCEIELTCHGQKNV